MKQQNVFDQMQMTYKERYQKPLTSFYDSLYSYFEMLSKGAVILDLGSGPGTVAEYASNRRYAITVLGIEPSGLIEDSRRLAQELTSNHSPTTYHPQKGSIEDSIAIHHLENTDLDGLALMRSPHEIAKSLGSKEAFFRQIAKLLHYVKPGGLIFIGDPCYAADIRTTPEHHQLELEKTKAFNIKQLGHCEEIHDFFCPSEIINAFEQNNCDLLQFQLHTNPELLDHIQKVVDPAIQRSPIQLYTMLFMIR